MTAQEPTNSNLITTEEKKPSQDIVNEECVCEDEMNQKKNENKVKYRRLRQKLTSMTYQHHEQSMMNELKEVTSPNKSRILRLGVELEKMTQTQNK